MAFGVVGAVVVRLNIAAHLIGGDETLVSPFFNSLTMVGTREFIGAAAMAHSVSFFSSIFVMMVLLVNRVVFRSQLRAWIAAFIVITIFITLAFRGNPAITGVLGLTLSALSLFVLVRFGFLALLAFATTRFLLAAVPLTFDTSHWYFPHGLMGVLILLAIAAFGIYAATSERSVPVRRSG